MPTYDYECLSCGHVFEVFHAISAPPPEECPSCQEKRIRRKIGAGAGLIFKGSGFYITDYRSEQYKKASQAEKPAKDTTKKTSDSGAAPSSGTTASPSTASAPAKPAATASE